MTGDIGQQRTAAVDFVDDEGPDECQQGLMWQTPPYAAHQPESGETRSDGGGDVRFHVDTKVSNSCSGLDKGRAYTDCRSWNMVLSSTGKSTVELPSWMDSNEAEWLSSMMRRRQRR